MPTASPVRRMRLSISSNHLIKRFIQSTVHPPFLQPFSLSTSTSSFNPSFALPTNKGEEEGSEKKKKKKEKMAFKLWASSAANALKLSCSGTRTSFPAAAFSISRCFCSVIDGLKYSPSHEWVKHEGTVATVGITDHAQGHLGEVVFVELPESGAAVKKGGSFGAVESVKATSDVNCPISGEIVEVNKKLTETPGLINKSPYEDGWMIKVKPSDPSELNSLMGPKDYTKFCHEEDAAH